ncbi:N-acetyltransferase family protein [Altererythrobacter sp.]|uniref:GNAT family N-acetyltransferase n=1 Tax=Altererythrobacter sp. TaxID=1872480 RepID=UPI003D06A5D3
MGTLAIDRSRTATTRNGVQLEFRAVTPEDEPLLEEFFDKVSDEDRRFRFLSAVGHVGHYLLEPMVTVDHFRTEGFLAFDRETGILAGFGMLACDKTMDSAEVAISVRSDYRGRGVGWAMLDLLADEADRRGAREVIAIEDRENHAAIELEREKGFTPRAMDGDPRLVVLAKSFR